MTPTEKLLVRAVKAAIAPLAKLRFPLINEEMSPATAPNTRVFALQKAQTTLTAAYATVLNEKFLFPLDRYLLRICEETLGHLRSASPICQRDSYTEDCLAYQTVNADIRVALTEAINSALESERP
jgi:hypothetical protein